MSDDDSISHWLTLLTSGDRSAVSPLWDHYFRRLVELAPEITRAVARLRRRGGCGPQRFDCFCRGAEQGRFPDLKDRDDLWRLLLVITARKAARLIGRETRQKRGGGKVRSASDLAHADAANEDATLAEAMAHEPSPEFAAEVAEECRRLLERLGDDNLRNIAIMQMDGYTVEEIANRTGLSTRSVYRKLAIIRHRWSGEDRPT